MTGVAAAILAAGASARLGRPKAWVEVDGRPLVLRAVDAARGAGCAPVVAVAGSEPDRLRAIVPHDVVVCTNPRWAEGMASSIRVALACVEAAAPDTLGLIVLVCDQPALDATVVSRLVDAWTATGRPAAAAEYAGVLGVPALFGRETWDVLRHVRGDRGARDWIRRNRSTVAAVPWPAGGRDVDHPGDLPPTAAS